MDLGGINKKLKKLLGIVVLSLVFYINPIAVEDSNSWTSNPLDKCMTRVIKGTYDGNERLAAAAAKLCLGN